MGGVVGPRAAGQTRLRQGGGRVLLVAVPDEGHRLQSAPKLMDCKEAGAAGQEVTARQVCAQVAALDGGEDIWRGQVQRCRGRREGVPGRHGQPEGGQSRVVRPVRTVAAGVGEEV